MERKDVPPPYDSGYVNQTHGQPSFNQGQQPPVMLQPQPAFTSSTSTCPGQPIVISQPQPQPEQASLITRTTVTISGAAPGECPVCHNRSWTGNYSCCAWLWCILCFPCGIICCLSMRSKKCTRCGFSPG